MRTSTVLWIVVIILVLGGGWWWYSQSSAPAAAPTGSAGLNGSADQGNMGQLGTGSVQQPGGGTSGSQNLALGINSNATLGEFLIGNNGLTLYTYSKDTAGVSNCSGQCAVNWPPYTITEGTSLNLPATITGKTATIKRADGTLQVTYKGMPLYFYKDDRNVGDTNGQAVGGVWYVVKP